MNTVITKVRVLEMITMMNSCENCCLHETDACPYVFVDNDEICDRFIKVVEE